ncbi:MAG TPA: Ig-like domain-containing protein [Galbitalea sp.]
MARRSLILTIVGGVVIAALVTAFAITSTGFTAQQLNLNDSSVWVANGTQQAIGRANTAVKQLNSVVSTTGNDLDVLQNSTTVMLVDNADSKLQVVDPATSTVTQTVPLPPNLPQVFLSKNNVVIVAATTGQVWITPISQISTFNAQSLPSLTFGPNVVASMDSNGVLFVYSPSAKKVERIEPDTSQAVVKTDDLSLPAKDTFQVTSVDGQWAVLDVTTARVYVPGGNTSLRGTAAAKTPALQLASATGERILVGGSTGLVALPLGGGTPTDLVRAENGAPTRPLSAGGCDFAAWTGGQAWRHCSSDSASSTGTTMPLSAMPSGAKLTLRSNGNRVVLNDSRSGATWAVQADGQLINNWNDLIAPKDQQQQQQKKNEDTPPQVEKQQLPPVAVDDNLGARPGRASVLPVLLNDYDPNGDVISITGDTGIDQNEGRVDLINNHQELQITLADGASGVITFRYTISDGRGGSASATVTVAVRGAGENSAPVQVQTSKTTVVQGGRVTTQVLGDWEDPDGDPMYVTSAAATAPDTVSYTPDGTLVYSDGGVSSGVKTVSVTVSDGKAETTGSLSVTVRAVGKVPIIADPFLQIATADQPLTISPLLHVRGGNAPLRLGNVPSKADVTITPSYDAGTFQFQSAAVGTHYLNYVVTDGSQSLTGVVRVDVVAPPESNTKPITIPKTVFVRALLSATVDIADSDIDPAGGVLLVTGVSNLDPDAGITAEILQQRSIRVRAVKPLDSPVVFDYTVSNGLASSTGTVTVVEIPTPDQLQPPIANPDSITVRTGAAIDIPVLANDSDPDGETLTLVPTLAQNVPAGAGLLFASGDVLRYLAPSRPGNYTAVYAVAGPDGQQARAQVKIAVREVDASTNNPPVPENLTSRVLAGGTVQIDVPLSGIDPDGDTVQLLGVQTNPQKGVVTTVGPHTITYQAGDYSTGTDTFTYGVTDALGARATGTVRVGIAGKPGGAPSPVATLDEVTVRPGTTVSVQVLANDSDPDGSPLHVVSAVPNDKVTKAKVVGNIVNVTPPTTPGTYGVIYTIANETGGQSSAFVRVTVDPKAPLSTPIASDTVLTLNDILDRTTLDVNVLANVFFADGPSSALGLSIYPGYGNTAQVTANKHIEITVTAHSQIIPFKVTHPDDPSVFSYAFIWVPGTDDALPQLNRTAPSLSVVSGSKLTIDLNDYVIAAQGKKVQLADTSSVTATHADGSPLVVDNRTLQFTSADQYFGPASISFQVTDGTSATDPNGRKAILTLPIKVLPKTNQPPVFIGGLINFEPGQSVDIDLVKQTNYPYQSDLGELSYTLLTPVTDGFSTSLSGQHLTIKANDNVATGTTSNVDVGVRDSNSTGTAGSIQLVVVPSTKPLAVPAPDSAIVQRGQSTTIDVLANDNATNPFPDTPLKVVAIRGLDGGSLPAGVNVTPSADRSKLSVTVSSGASPGDTTLQYEVSDATNDPARYVWGNVTISVEDRPDPVTNVRTTSFSDQQLILNWNNGPANNSAILDYQVVETDATSGKTLSTTTCGGPLCAIATPGNGPSYSVRLAVTARNAIGSSDPTSNPGPVWSDIIPAAPTALAAKPLDHGLDITWSPPPPTGGSPITSYVISVDGTTPRTVDAGTLEVSIQDAAGIANGSAVNYSVSARNSAFASLASWNSASGTGFPAGPPLYQPSSPPVASAVGDDGTSARLSWSTSFDSNGAAITDYRAAVFNAGDSAPSCSPSVGQDAGGAQTTVFTGLQQNHTYNFIVFAFNAMGCGTSDIVTLIVHPVPGTVTGVNTSGPLANGTNTWDYRLNSVTIADGSATTDEFEYQLSGGSVDGSSYGPLPYSRFLQTSNSSQYGNDIQVQVRACASYTDATICSDNWSAPFELGVPVANTDLPGLAFSHPDFNLLGPAVDGTWTWSAGLPQAAYDTITYDCGNGPQTLDPNNPGSCTATQTNVLVPDFPPLTISIGVNGHHYVRTYNWSDYD